MCEWHVNIVERKGVHFNKIRTTFQGSFTHEEEEEREKILQDGRSTTQKLFVLNSLVGYNFFSSHRSSC